MLSLLLVVVLSAVSVLGLPNPQAAANSVAGGFRGTTQDAPYDVPDNTLQQAITCPVGIRKLRGGIVLLVHGTGSTGSESWSQSPYYLLLPTDPNGPGFDICWIDLPDRALGDAQTSAEYIAYAIKLMAPNSATGKVSIIAHSQGAGLNVQWALDFWPSTVNLVSDFVALAGDFHGTELGNEYCPDVGEGCVVTIIQQSIGSQYLSAQNGRGGSSLVPTTSIHTLNDDFVFPQPAQSTLNGATNIGLQDSDICGPGHYAIHWDMIVDTAAYGLALDALSHSGTASPSRFNSRYCDYYLANPGLNLSSTAVTASAECMASLSSGPIATIEPKLKSYVCSEGQSSYC